MSKVTHVGEKHDQNIHGSGQPINEDKVSKIGMNIPSVKIQNRQTDSRRWRLVEQDMSRMWFDNSGRRLTWPRLSHLIDARNRRSPRIRVMVLPRLLLY